MFVFSLNVCTFSSRVCKPHEKLNKNSSNIARQPVLSLCMRACFFARLRYFFLFLFLIIFLYLYLCSMCMYWCVYARFLWACLSLAICNVIVIYLILTCFRLWRMNGSEDTRVSAWAAATYFASMKIRLWMPHRWARLRGSWITAVRCVKNWDFGVS